MYELNYQEIYQNYRVVKESIFSPVHHRVILILEKQSTHFNNR